MGALTSLATAGLNFALANQGARRQNREIAAGRDQQIAEIQERDAEERRKQEEALRRRLAAERARAGAAGVGSGGSSQAVLRGLLDQTEAELAADRRQSARQIGDIRESAARAQRRNLLELTGSATRTSLRSLGSRRSLLDL
jgi:hypothetical protein